LAQFLLIVNQLQILDFQQRGWVSESEALFASFLF